MNGLQDILARKQSMLDKQSMQPGKNYVTTSHQARALELADKLGVRKDKRKLGWLFGLTKNDPQFCERAYSWVSDYPNARDKFRLFIWKISDLKKSA